ncbi:hypothetical protein CsatB_008881 [Cannabis sativa]
MGFYFPYNILPFLTLLFVASHAVQSPELYWKSVLPNTPMPKAVTNLLQSDILREEKSTSVNNVGDKGGTNVDVGVGNKGGTNVGVGVGVGTKGGTNVGVGGKEGGVSVNTTHKGKPVYVGVGVKGKDPFVYKYAANETQLHDNPSVALFFLDKDIQPGTQMNLNFVKSSTSMSSTSTFLPRQVAQSIPFSSKKLPEILNKLSVKPHSEEAEMVKQTIEECEEPSIKGEDKYCATSLESMIDFTTSKLGNNNNVQAISTNVVEEKESVGIQKYTIKQVEKKRNSNSKVTVVCHKLNYPFAVFYCHTSQATEAYMVTLQGSDDGNKVKAVAACHKDTSGWNPNHLAFKVLNVKQGTVPVCHFLPQDHIVWIQN